MATSRYDSHYVVDAAGELWSWGSNEYGELGHDDTTERKTPKLIQALKGKQVKEISTGNACAACITGDNTCFVWGDCERFKAVMSTRQRVKLLFGSIEEMKNTPIKLDRKMKSISIGYGHALMIDTADDVYAIGSNFFGELGLGDKKNRSEWTKLTKLTGRAIKVQCGSFHSAVLTTSGVYTMGEDFGGVTPQLIELMGVADISMKYEHILALTNKGELYAWGHNGYGQCGVGSSGCWIAKPTRVRGLDDYHIRQISAGCNYSLLRCEPKSQ